MKTLLLVRHAKSSWDDPAITDFDRPLNERGKKDAPIMARRLLEKRITIDTFISSPAKRAKKTAKIFIEAFDRKEDEIIVKPELYLAHAGVFETVLNSIGMKSEIVALFSHNPGITDFANSLTDARIDNIPTCGIFAISIDTKSWEDFNNAKKSFLFFDYPKA